MVSRAVWDQGEMMQGWMTGWEILMEASATLSTQAGWGTEMWIDVVVPVKTVLCLSLSAPTTSTWEDGYLHTFIPRSCSDTSSGSPVRRIWDIWWSGIFKIVHCLFLSVAVTSEGSRISSLGSNPFYTIYRMASGTIIKIISSDCCRF